MSTFDKESILKDVKHIRRKIDLIEDQIYDVANAFEDQDDAIDDLENTILEVGNNIHDLFDKVSDARA